MCKKYTTGQKREDSGEVRAGQEIEFEAVECEAFSGMRITAKLKGRWAGSATHDKLKSYWLSKRFPGNQLVQITKDVTGISETDRETGEDIWAPAPEGTRLFFVLEASPPGRSYRLAKLVTVKARPEERAYFRQENDSVPLTGRIENKEIVPVPLPPVPKRIIPQGELF